MENVKLFQQTVSKLIHMENVLNAHGDILSTNTIAASYYHQIVFHLIIMVNALNVLKNMN